MSRPEPDQSSLPTPTVVAAILIGILLAVALGLVITTGGFGLFTDDLENGAPATVNDTTDDDSELDENDENDVTDDETDTQDETDDEATDQGGSADDSDGGDEGDESGTAGADTTPSDDESDEEAIDDGTDNGDDSEADANTDDETIIDGDAPENEVTTDGDGEASDTTDSEEDTDRGDEDDTASGEDTVDSDDGAEDDEGDTDDTDEEESDNGDEGDDTGTDPGEPGPDTSTLTVEVVTDDTGEPIDSEVHLRGPADDPSDLDESEERTLLTGADGTVTFEDLADGHYEVYADPVDYDVNNAGLYFWEPIEIDSSDVTTTHELPPAPRDHTLTFEVTDNGTGESIEGATVEVFFVYIWNGADMIIEETTDATGTATVDVVNTVVNYEVDAPGYKTESDSLEVEENQTITVDLDPDEPETHTLTVQTIGEDREPLQSEVTISDPDTGNVIAVSDTDEDGTVTFDLQNGQYHVKADPGYEISEEYSGDVIEISGSDETIVHEVPSEPVKMLEVTDMFVEGDDPEEEFIELTNVGDVALDMSDWIVRDREEHGKVAAGYEPITFPDPFVLEPGESVTIITAPGEDTNDTVHWGYEQQNWNQEGDVIIVLDGGGEEVLRHEYGDPPEDNDNGDGDDVMVTTRMMART